MWRHIAQDFEDAVKEISAEAVELRITTTIHACLMKTIVVVVASSCLIARAPLPMLEDRIGISPQWQKELPQTWKAEHNLPMEEHLLSLIACLATMHARAPIRESAGNATCTILFRTLPWPWQMEMPTRIQALYFATTAGKIVSHVLALAQPIVYYTHRKPRQLRLLTMHCYVTTATPLPPRVEESVVDIPMRSTAINAKDSMWNHVLATEETTQMFFSHLLMRTHA